LTDASRHGALANDEQFEAAFFERGVRNAVVDLIESVCVERPIFCHVDDADALDDASLGAIRAMHERLLPLPLLLVFTGRRDFASTELTATRLHLKPLETSDLRSLAASYATNANLRLSVEAIDWCISLSSGNPAHLEQLLAHAAATIGVPTAPPDLVALTDQRIASLSPTALHALQACAVFGPASDAASVASLTGLSGYELLIALEALEESSLATISSTGMQCRNTMIEERTQLSLSMVTRQLFHRRAAEYLEAREQGKATSQETAWEISAHWQEAGCFGLALRWRAVCWRQLISIGQPVAATASIRDHLAHCASPSDRAFAMDVLIEALQSAAEPLALIDALKERSALSERLSEPMPVRRALAFDLLEASLHYFEDSGPQIERVRAHAESSELDVRRRMRATRMLVIAADNAVNSALAAHACAVNESLAPTDIQSRLYHLNTRLIYEAVFGDRSVALESADAMLAIANDLPHSALAVQSALNIAMARRIVDSSLPSLEGLEHRFEACQAAGMKTQSQRVAARIATILLEDGDVAGASGWGSLARRLADELGSTRQSGDYLTSQIDLALLGGDLERADALVNALPGLSPVYATPRLSKEMGVYRVRVDQYCQRPIDDSSLETLLTWHERARHFGRHDDHMEVLWVALNSRGECERASELLAEYLNHSRRERRSCNYLLRLRTASDPIWNRAIT
jgi:hypothetical protein